MAKQYLAMQKVQRGAARKRDRPRGPTTQISEGQITFRVPTDLRARLEDELLRMRRERPGESLSLSDVIRSIVYAYLPTLEAKRTRR